MEGVTEPTIEDAVRAGWGLTIDELRYVPEGGGAYHWGARSADGGRWFLTCDDLTTKPWLGADPTSVFDGLLAAYGTAIELRTAGLAFVATPIPSIGGAPAVRIDERHSLALFDYIDGVPGRWGLPCRASERRALVAMLARLHASTAAVRVQLRRGFEVPDRDAFEHLLDDLGHPWAGGPLSEPARRELARHVAEPIEGLADLDRFAVRLGGGGEVVTHGEPHPGNLIRTGAGPVLVDWNTVALARPERDLWMIVGPNSADFRETYRDRTGITLDPEALVAYRLVWVLTDLVAFSLFLRGEHRLDEDAELALAALRSILNGLEPAPHGRSSPSGERRLGAVTLIANTVPTDSPPTPARTSAIDIVPLPTAEGYVSRVQTAVVGPVVVIVPSAVVGFSPGAPSHAPHSVPVTGSNV
jgi:spectinomycin phosphotransferase